MNRAGDEFDSWGYSVWYFEIDGESWPVRQVEVYDSGPVLRHGPGRKEDQYGGLGQASLDDPEEGWSQYVITREVFEQVWDSVVNITVFGDRATFAIEIGEPVSVGLRVVDMWAAGERLTADDNVGYVPSLGHYLQTAAAQVDQRRIRPIPVPGRSPEEVFRLLEADETDLRERYWFLRWSETLDNVSSYAYLEDDLVIVFALRQAQTVPHESPKVFVARVTPEQFVAVLREAAAQLVAP